MKKIALLSLFSLLCVYTFSQGTRWKRTRYELVGGIGVSNFFGDLGGGGSGLSYYKRFLGDVEISSTRPSILVGMRYKVTPSLSVRYNIIYGFLHGADKLSNDEGRKARNLSFYTHIVENDFIGEYSIIKESNSKRWSARQKRKIRSYSLNLYLFGGIGGFYFDPRAKSTVDGKYYRLRNIGTEGQTDPNSGKNKYLPVALCVPVGLGVKVGLNRLWDVGIEYGYRWTMTDYIDDVGGSYYDNAAIIEANGGAGSAQGKAAGFFADNHIGETFEDNMQTGYEKDADKNAIYAAAYKSGDRIPYPSGTAYRSGSANDYYMFLMVTISYKLRTGRNGLPKFKF